jgi:hypothetical protein
MLSMKKIISQLFVMSCLLASMNPLYAQWVQTNGFFKGDISSFAVSDANFFVGAHEGFYSSTDNGASWNLSNTGLPNTYIMALTVIDTNIFAGTPFGVFRSSDNGAHWTEVNTGLTSHPVGAFAVSGINLFVGTAVGVFRSSDNGASWNDLSNGIANTTIRAFAISGSNIFAGGTQNFSNADGGGVFRSTDNGTHWTKVNTGLTENNVRMLAAIDTDIYVGMYGGSIFHSIDNGVGWSLANGGQPHYDIQAFAVYGSNLFVGCEGQGVFQSYDKGRSWSAFNTGFGFFPRISALIILNGVIYAGRNDGGGNSVWRRPLTDLTAVNEHPTLTPPQMSLDQNYPNPFNPSTTISFSLPSRSFVTVKIFDVVGREVATLVSEEMPAGNYQRQWNATGFPSGMYFYRMQAGGFVQTKKILLVR